MRDAHWHVFQVLTKRHERMRALLSNELEWVAQLPNVWFGVSVEDRKYGLPRLRTLQDSPARTRFLSIEPLLEDLGRLDLTGINWTIVGGESGPRARPIREEWVAAIQQQCAEQGVPFFFKQWGGTRKHLTGRQLHGKTYDEFPLTFTTRPAAPSYGVSHN